MFHQLILKFRAQLICLTHLFLNFLKIRFQYQFDLIFIHPMMDFSLFKFNQSDLKTLIRLLKLHFKAFPRSFLK